MPDSQAGKATPAGAGTGLAASERAELERLKAEVAALQAGEEARHRSSDAGDRRRNGAVVLAVLALLAVTAGLAVLLTELSVPFASVWVSIVLGLPPLYLGLKALQPPATARAPSRGDWQDRIASLLIVVGCLLAPLAVLAVWTANEVSNTPRYVATVEPLIHEPAIQNALTDKITTAITTHLNVAGDTGFVHTQAHKIVTSPQAANLWIQINRTTHDQLIKVLSGQDNNAISTNNFQVNLDLEPFINVIKQDLAKQGFTFIGKLPPIHPTITLFASKNLVQAQALYQLMTTLKWVLPFLSLLLIALGVYLMRNHRRALIGAGLGLAGSMVVLGGLLPVVRGAYIHSVPAAVNFDILVRFIKQALGVLLVIGLVVAAAAYFTGPSHTAVRARHAFRSGLAWLRHNSERMGLRTGPVGPWVYQHRVGLHVGVSALMILILVLWAQPTYLIVLALAIVLLVLLGLIEMIGKPPTIAQKWAKHLMGEVSGYYAHANVVQFSIEDWRLPRTLELAVPRDEVSPELWDTVAKLHDGAVVKADVLDEPGSSGVADFKFIWNADGTPGPDNDGSPEMAPAHWIVDPGYFGFERYFERVRSERLAKEDLERPPRELEEAKQTGHLLLDDGKVNTWHGVTPSGRQCHHRHRSPEAASGCAARLQQREGGPVSDAQSLPTDTM
jgi:hypothetical protein